MARVDQVSIDALMEMSWPTPRTEAIKLAAGVGPKYEQRLLRVFGYLPTPARAVRRAVSFTPRTGEFGVCRLSLNARGNRVSAALRQHQLHMSDGHLDRTSPRTHQIYRALSHREQGLEFLRF